MDPPVESYISVFPADFSRVHEEMKSTNAARHPTVSLPPTRLSICFPKQTFNFNSSGLISAAFHICMLISHLRPVAVWLFEC